VKAIGSDVDILWRRTARVLADGSAEGPRISRRFRPSGIGSWRRRGNSGRFVTSRPRDGRYGILPVRRQYVRNVNSAWGACTPTPLPASRRSTHFKPLGILKSPHATTACGAPSRSSDLNGQGRPPLEGGEGDPKPSIRCDREWERFKRIKRRIISCAQLGSRTFERTRTNQEVYYQPTGAKTQ
jgi:hypothetical protein